MTGQIQFQVDQIGATVQMLGDLSFSIDPLNGADFLFVSSDMISTANAIIVDYTKTQWAPRTIRVYEKSVLPPGHIIGMRQPTPGMGAFVEPCWALTPAGAVPTYRIEAEDLAEIVAE